MRTESWESREEGRRLICYLLHGPIARRAKTKSNLWGDVAASSSSSSSFFYFSGCIFLSFSFLPTTHTHIIPLAELSCELRTRRKKNKTHLLPPLSSALLSCFCSTLSLCGVPIGFLYLSHIRQTYDTPFPSSSSSSTLNLLLSLLFQEERKKERKSVEFLETILIAMAAAADRQS